MQRRSHKSELHQRHLCKFHISPGMLKEPLNAPVAPVQVQHFTKHDQELLCKPSIPTAPTPSPKFHLIALKQCTSPGHLILKVNMNCITFTIAYDDQIAAGHYYLCTISSLSISQQFVQRKVQQHNWFFFWQCICSTPTRRRAEAHG